VQNKILDTLGSHLFERCIFFSCYDDKYMKSCKFIFNFQVSACVRSRLYEIDWVIVVLLSMQCGVNNDLDSSNCSQLTSSCRCILLFLARAFAILCSLNIQA